MNTSRNSIKTESGLAQAPFCPLACAAAFRQGWERVFEASKTSLKAVEENAEVFASYQKALKVPNPFLFDLADRALKGYVTFQKSLLDIAADQSRAGLKATEEVGHDDCESNAGMIQSSLRPALAGHTSVLMDTDADAIELRMLAKEIVDLAIVPEAKPTIQ